MNNKFKFNQITFYTDDTVCEEVKDLCRVGVIDANGCFYKTIYDDGIPIYVFIEGGLDMSEKELINQYNIHFKNEFNRK